MADQLALSADEQVKLDLAELGTRLRAIAADGVAILKGEGEEARLPDVQGIALYVTEEDELPTPSYLEEFDDDRPKRLRPLKLKCARDEQVELLANGLFITDGGKPIWDHIHRLHDQFGFNVTPGETDSFGWLSGQIVVHLQKQNIDVHLFFG